MANLWPAEFEPFAEQAVNAVSTARECADQARDNGGLTRRELVADCRSNLAQAAVNVHQGAQVRPAGTRWPKNSRIRLQLIQDTLATARRRVESVPTGDDGLDRATLAEVAAYCSDLVWFLTAA